MTMAAALIPLGFGAGRTIPTWLSWLSVVLFVIAVDMLLKQLTKRNDEEGSRLNHTQLEIDRYVLKNQSLRSDVKELEEELDEKKNSVHQNR